MPLLLLLLPLLLLLQPSSSAPSPLPSWQPLGAPLQHDHITALAGCFSSAPGSSPILAYGADDASADTTVRFLGWNSSGSGPGPAASGNWSLLASHTPQFAQPYGHFSVAERQGLLYLGLSLTSSEDPAAAGLSSVLRGLAEPGTDGFEGCYAFQSDVFAWQLDAGGSLRAALSPDNASLGLATYDASGWDSYPASDAWGPLLPVAHLGSGQLDSVQAAASSDGRLLTAFSGAGALQLGVGSLASSALPGQWSSLGSPLGPVQPAVGPALAWLEPASGSGGSASAVLCVAAHAPSGSSGSGSVAVACSSNASAAGWGSSPVLALPGSDPRLAPGLALAQLPSGELRLALVAASASSPGQLLSAACSLSAEGQPLQGCDLGPAGSLPPLSLPGKLNNFVLSAPAPWQQQQQQQQQQGSVLFLLLASTGAPDAAGDALQAFSLQ
jgi:hypothetical protein